MNNFKVDCIKCVTEIQMENFSAQIVRILLGNWSYRTVDNQPSQESHTSQTTAICVAYNPVLTPLAYNFNGTMNLARIFSFMIDL